MAWGEANDLGNPAPVASAPQVAGSPMDISPAAQNAANPQAGAGWKQNVNKIAGAVGDAAGNFQINNGQVGQRGGQPQQGQKPPGQGNPNDLKARADALLAQGILSPTAHAQIMASLAGGAAGSFPQPVGPPGGYSSAWGQ